MAPHRANARDEYFALLDDASAPDGVARSRFYTGWRRTLTCTGPEQLEAFHADLRRALAEGLRAVLLADYEWGARLGGAATVDAAPGVLEALLFTQCTSLDRRAVDACLRDLDTPPSGPEAAQADEPTEAGFSRLDPSVTDDAFTRAIERIHDWIRAGETYQVNYTYRLQGQAWGEPVALYRRLRQRQPVAFGALIHRPPREAGGTEWILSCSPELFLEHRAGVLRTRPMKGTAARLAPPEADNAIAFWLADDEKNRAENLMIVDLLRNDIGRIARTGSVKVPQLFAVEPYRTVYQMTSTVQGELPPATDLPQVVRALFPCGSITGAPKRHTMDLIAQLETTPRGLYTGAIGWLDASTEPERSLGDFTLSVAIRTAELGPVEADGSRRARLGVGAGITLDSVAADEARECRLKARFATALPHRFTLFETLRAEDAALPRREAHLARLGASAQALGFAFDPEQARTRLQEALASLAPGAHRMRLDLDAEGALTLSTAPLPPLPEGPVDLGLWTGAPVDTPRALRRHKTSLRAVYDRALQQAQAAGLFDLLFTDAEGWLTEGARTSVFVQLGGRWYTPPLSAGVLAGVMRAEILADPAWAARERPIHRDELAQAQALMVCNALRGPRMARYTGRALGDRRPDERAA